MNRRVVFAAALIFGILATVVLSRTYVLNATAQANAAFTPPQGLQNLPILMPADNALTAGRIALGKQLFFDTRLSRTQRCLVKPVMCPKRAGQTGWRSRQDSTAA